MTKFLVGASSAKLFLAVIVDVFSCFVVDWSVSAVNDRHLTIKALEMAIRRRCPSVGLLHHSNRGCTTQARTTRTLSPRTASPAR
jgi:putative transposase